MPLVSFLAILNLRSVWHEVFRGPSAEYKDARRAARALGQRTIAAFRSRQPSRRTQLVPVRGRRHSFRLSCNPETIFIWSLRTVSGGQHAIAPRLKNAPARRRTAREVMEFGCAHISLKLSPRLSSIKERSKQHVYSKNIS